MPSELNHGGEGLGGVDLNTPLCTTRSAPDASDVGGLNINQPTLPAHPHTQPSPPKGCDRGARDVSKQGCDGGGMVL